jgi:long-chain-fatty-acid--CoA ligase ACSBG
METSTIIYIILALAIVIILFYYFWYIRSEDHCKKDIPYKLLYEQEKTIVDLMKDISKKYGRYPALKKKTKGIWKTISYSEYYDISNNIAEKLLYAVGPHPRVAILSFNRPEWFCTHMGTMISGGVSIGIYPTASPSNCTFITNHSHIDILVIEDAKQLAKFTDVKMPTVKYILVLDPISEVDLDEGSESENILESIKKLNPNINIVEYETFMNQPLGSGATNTVIEIRKPFPEDIATIIYTSGTTGDPKGAVITHKNIISSIKAGLNAIQSRSNINISVQESYISYLPLNHVAAQMMDIYVPLASVGVVHFAEKDAMKGSLKDTIKEVQPTIFIGVPRIWEKIYEKIKENQEDPQRLINKLFVNKLIIREIGLDKTKYCITAATPMSQEIRDFFKNLGLEICDVYGMTETTGPISMGVPGCSQGVGVPVMDVKIEKETGEITVKGDSVFKEYYKNNSATKESFTSKGWFKTGDTGYVDRDGSLYVTGRIKDLIITAGGENISPVPIEDELMSNLNKDKKYFEYAIVVGDQKKFLSVLLIPTKKYNSLKVSDESIKQSIDVTNKKAPNSASTLKKFVVLEGEVFEIGDLLTPTLKIRRKNICDRYKYQIDALYQSEE